VKSPCSRQTPVQGTEEVSGSCIERMEDHEDDTAARISRLNLELRDLDIEHERERQELLASCALPSEESVAHFRTSSKRSTASLEDNQEGPSSVGQASANPREESLPLTSLGIPEKPLVAAAKTGGEESKSENGGHSPEAKGKEAEQSVKVKADLSALTAESSYLRYVVQNNEANMARNHKEVADLLRGKKTERPDFRPSSRPVSSTERYLDSFVGLEAPARKRSGKSFAATSLEGGHPEVAEELRRRTEEKERRYRSAVSGSGRRFEDTNLAFAASCVSSLYAKRRDSPRLGLQDPSTVLEGLSRYTPRGSRVDAERPGGISGQQCASRRAEALLDRDQDGEGGSSAERMERIDEVMGSMRATGGAETVRQRSRQDLMSGELQQVAGEAVHGLGAARESELRVGGMGVGMGRGGELEVEGRSWEGMMGGVTGGDDAFAVWLGQRERELEVREELQGWTRVEGSGVGDQGGAVSTSGESGGLEARRGALQQALQQDRSQQSLRLQPLQAQAGRSDRYAFRV
jgi:hypothetical protein